MWAYLKINRVGAESARERLQLYNLYFRLPLAPQTANSTAARGSRAGQRAGSLWTGSRSARSRMLPPRSHHRLRRMPEDAGGRLAAMPFECEVKIIIIRGTGRYGVDDIYAPHNQRRRPHQHLKQAARNAAVGDASRESESKRERVLAPADPIPVFVPCSSALVFAIGPSGASSISLRPHPGRLSARVRCSPASQWQRSET